MTPWGPIIAAMIAGFIAFIGMLITKESKVSEFRQAWINEFREEISLLVEAYKEWAYTTKNYQTHLSISLIYLVESESSKSHREKSKWYEQVLLESKSEIERYKGRIKLRLNSDLNRRSDEENELDDLLEKIIKTTDLKLVEALSDKIYLNSSLILSTEWKVVKKGESSYVKAKESLLWLAIFLGFIGGVGFCFHLQEAMGWLMNNPPPLIKN